jgi:outer membrane receptor protein involved in Fe transport
MKKLLFPILLIFSGTLQAQIIRGKVCLDSDRSPAQFASVGLMQMTDSAILSGVITMTDGGYMFENVKPGLYAVKVSFVGYKADDKMVEITGSHDEIRVDTIFLVETATSLEEVTVTAERLKGQEMVDRTIYAIPSQVAKVSTNGYELLKKIPQVNVDFQNNVTLNGSSNFIIQVDGRQRDKEFLAKLLPSDIESIEIINNPSGKYEGNIDGVINIILKKEARYGMNGNASLYVKPFNKFTTTASGSLDYSAGKITYYITAYTFAQNLSLSSSTSSHFFWNDSISYMQGEGDLSVTSSSVNTGFDYYMNDRNSLSLNINYKPIHQDVDMFSNTELTTGGSPVGNYTSLTNNELQSGEGNVSLFYKKTFKKSIQEFTSDFNYYTFHSSEMNDFKNTNYLLGSEEPSTTVSRMEDNLNQRDYLSAKFNYVHPLGMSAKLEAGYQAYYQKMSYEFRVNDQESGNHFLYAELRNSLYGGFTLNVKKLGFQAILRMENSDIDADSVTEPNYTCLLPSANLQYKFSATHNLKLTYNRRINRPTIYDLDPYLRVGQNYELSQGNPDLRPEYRDKIQLTYTWNFGNNYFSPSLYYESLSNKISRGYVGVMSPTDSIMTTYSKPYNLLSGYEFGGGVNAMLWFFNINARIYKGHYDAYSATSYYIPERDYFSYSLTSYAFHNLDKKKTWNAYAFISYNGVNVDAQSKTYSMPFYGFGAQKQIKDHSIGFFWLLPFSKDVKFQRTVTETPSYSMENIIGFDVSYYIQFMYSYKFNRGKNVKKVDRDIEVESDSKTQGIGN